MEGMPTMKMLAEVNEDGLQRIASFLSHGLDSTTILQALCRQLKEVKPTTERNAASTAADLAHAMAGMLIHLQVIRDTLEEIEHTVVVEVEDEADEVNATTEPAVLA
jgi:asparagine synthetase B (glutamine-hydrolysing)